MKNLQPYLVFNNEATRLNALYWSSQYSYERTLGFLDLMIKTAASGPDPRVDQLWSAAVVGQKSSTTQPFSKFSVLLSENSNSLRTASILQICSAFENALVGYFSLAALYQPLLDDPNCTFPAIPMLLHNPSQYDARKKEILLAADAKLHGKYSKRVRVITDTWNLTAFSPSVLGKLNSYYATRHLIAHDQGIDNADAPERSSTEILAGRVSITEDKWKKLIADFSNVLLELDQRIVQNVVKDRGLPLAIYRILERDGPQELGDFGPKLANEWRLGHVSKAATRSAAISIGLKIKQINGNRYRVSR